MLVKKLFLLLQSPFHVPQLGKYLITRSASTYWIKTYKMNKEEPDPSTMTDKDINRLLTRARHQKRRALGERFTPANVLLQVLGSGARGVPSALFVSTDHSKYLFNCGEGSQRIAHEYRLKLGKLEHVFFTTAKWKNMGGLPGMALTIQDSGVPKIDLHGPRGILDIFDAVKRFVNLTHLSVNEAECDENQVYEDSCMSIRYVHLKKANPESEVDSDEALIPDDTDYYAHEANPAKRKSVKSLWQKRDEPTEPQKRPLVKKVTGCVAYVCKLVAKTGTLNLEKCVDKGIKAGPILGRLKAGEDVVLEDGTVVKSADVCDPSTPGPVFIVVECPDEDYLDSLTSHTAFEDYQAHTDVPDNVAQFIVHFSPPEIMNHPRYVEWMKRFASTTGHLVINHDSNCYNVEAVNRLQHQLNLIHPTIFPELHDLDETHQKPKAKPRKDLIIHQAKTLNTISLRPLEGLDEGSVVRVNRKANIDEVIEKEGFVEVQAVLQRELEARSQFLEQAPKFPKIHMLGTGSCIPNKTRNTSGILLRIDETTNILMDCGEGTVGQLIRFYGYAEASKVLKNIKGIYLSHLHADHHLGLLGIIQERKNFTDEPLYLIAPKQIESWLRLYHRKFEKIDDCFILVPNQGIVMEERRLSADADEELRQKLRIQDVNTVEVKHCLHSFAVAWTLLDGKKIVYSGDTRPCQSIVNLGKDCDLLIHEATMEDGLEDEAIKKMHSTISEAITIGQKMNAKFTFLTHFSQRYSKFPRLPDNRENIFNNVGIAFDNMHFSLAEVILLPLFYPSLQEMFSDFQNILEERAQKRAKRLK